jgi:hypothetical protein
VHLAQAGRELGDTVDRDAPCDVQRAMRPVLRGALRVAAIACAATLGPMLAGEGRAARPPVLQAPFERMPIDPPHVITGNFGEARQGRYHGGLDFSTGGAVGRPVFAPAAGRIERVRTSGTGYGRSLYLATDDGRLVLLAHLDAFDEPLASWVAGVQDSTGDYEQDLWPARDRFPVHAGQRLGWTGQSGAGPPHLHVEVRRGDMAYNPLRAGLEVADRRPPELRWLTLEPLDARSFVDRGAGPLTLSLALVNDTVVVEGRVRAVVDARDSQTEGSNRLIPWATGITFGGASVTCQFDSAMWGGDIVDAEMVYDRGRASRGNGLVLWRSNDYGPTVMLAEGFGASTAIEVEPGAPPRSLRVFSRDTGGNQTSRTLWLRGPLEGERGPDTSRAGGTASAAAWPGAFEFTVLPERHVRVEFRGAPGGSRGVLLCERPASFGSGRWTAVVPFDAVLGDSAFEIRGRDAKGRPWSQRFAGRVARDDDGRWSFSTPQPFDWWMDPDVIFEPAVLAESEAGKPRGTAELAPIGGSWRLEPETLALRGPVHVSVELPAGAPGERVLIYRSEGSGWTSVGGTLETSSSRRIEAGTLGLGRFALFADTLAPRVTHLTPRTASRRGGYSRWALEARVREDGSGVDPARSHFVVDGRRVPTEWDAEANRLRWRPLRRPAAGRHVYEVVATDAAGNERRTRGTFVLD